MKNLKTDFWDAYIMLTHIHVRCALGQNRLSGLDASARNRHTVIIQKQLFGLRGPQNGCFQRNQKSIVCTITIRSRTYTTCRQVKTS